MKNIKVYESFGTVNEGMTVPSEMMEKLKKKAITMLSKIKGNGNVVKFEDAKGNKWELGVVAEIPNASAHEVKDGEQFSMGDYILTLEYVNKATSTAGSMSMGNTFELHSIKKLSKTESIISTISDIHK